MHNPQPRPVFLDPLRIRLPAPALVSLAHRLAGLLLALSVPGLIYLLDLSLQGPEGFASVLAWLQSGSGRLLSALSYWALLHHLLAGVRFLLIDLGVGIARGPARASAVTVLVAAVIAAVLVYGVLT